MYNAVKNGSTYDFNYKEFVCDTMDDMNAIRTKKLAAGATAVVLETGERYILSNEKKWVFQAVSTGGSTGGDLTPEDAVELLAETDVLQPVASADGKLYTDENGKIFVI